ncbi:MAG: phosphoadenosine phosphosulfate reductase [Sulfitobacter sp.]|nr:phosphoadenosine phosphosulfate reductase [Sulfitobacter sp.]
MSQEATDMDSSLAGLAKRDWIASVELILEGRGSLTPLGKRHLAAFAEGNDILLVTFETLQGIQALSELGQPLGWDMVKSQGWSHLCIASDGDTWFRDPALYGHFDSLIDEGFFDEFDQVIFYGAGPCGYAAAAYSVAAPGATVLAIQPQATLDPRITEWDPRFVEMRASDFTTRYGYAPDMLDAAEDAFILYDPNEPYDAMHAALFTRPNVTKFRMRFMGDALQTDLLDMEQWDELLIMAQESSLDTLSFARLYRGRRDYRPYLRNLLKATEREGRDPLTLMICKNVTARMKARMFAARIGKLEARMNGTETDEQPD